MGRSWAVAQMLLTLVAAVATAGLWVRSNDLENRLTLVEAASESRGSSAWLSRLPASVIPIGAAAALGSDRAQVGLIIYSDFHCPYCEQFATDVFPEIVRTYVDSNRVLVVFRNYPLKIHPRAVAVAVAGVCAAQQGLFWKFHDVAFRTFPKIGQPGQLRNVNIAVGADPTKFDTCIQAPGTAKQVESDITEAKRFGLSGTPGFIIGYRKEDGLVTTSRIKGAQPFARFAEVLDDLLAKSER